MISCRRRPLRSPSSRRHVSDLTSEHKTIRAKPLVIPHDGKRAPADRMKRTWQRLGSFSNPRRTQLGSVPFLLSFQCRRDLSTTFPVLSSEVQDEPTRLEWKHNQYPIKWIRADAEREEERQKLHVEVGYTEIYGRYLAAVNGAVGDPIPLEIHQAVLRACTPSPKLIHTYTAQSLRDGTLQRENLAHPYESRFKKIIQNITVAGFSPVIEDYHFIMSQLAAVGNFTGIRGYMRHMDRVGLQPNEETYGFLLQAIACRIFLPTSVLIRPDIVRQLVDPALQVLREMSHHRIPPSTENLDLVFRVFSNIYDPQGLDDFLRIAYGIDLNYLDSPPIGATSVSNPEPSPETLPFSTNALNTLLDTLGRWGNISTMICAFETLTNPLPAPAKLDNTFDDDDDDFIPIRQEWKTPSAEPTTTTFNILIKHCAAGQYSWLAKHYATQLMDKEAASKLKLLESKGNLSSEVASPQFAVNAGTLQPIHGLANRTHDVKLLQWTIRKSMLSVRSKYRSWLHYRWISGRDDSEPAPSTLKNTDLPETSSLTSASSSTPDSLRQPAVFDIPTHLGILQRDIAAISTLKWHTENRLFSAISRNKARLVRRILEGKDIYMEDKGRRVKVLGEGRTKVMDPEVLVKMVRFSEDKRAVQKKSRTPARRRVRTAKNVSKRP